MSDLDELPAFTGSGDPREEALWEAYQAMLRRRKDPRARSSAPATLPAGRSRETSAPPRPPEPRPAPARPNAARRIAPRSAAAQAAEPGPLVFQPIAPDPGAGRAGPPPLIKAVGAGRRAALGAAVVLAGGAALAIALWPHAPPPPSGAKTALPAPRARASSLASDPPAPELAPRSQPGADVESRPIGENSPRRVSVLVVREFYDALGRGDGERAAAVVIPEKRGEGHLLSARALTRFYSTLQAPLRVTELEPTSDDTVFVRYQFVARRDHLCLGSATVRTTRRDGDTLIKGIRTFSGC